MTNNHEIKDNTHQDHGNQNTKKETKKSSVNLSDLKTENKHPSQSKIDHFSFPMHDNNDGFIAKIYKEGDIRTIEGKNIIKNTHVSYLIKLGDIKRVIRKEAVTRVMESIKNTSRIKTMAEEAGMIHGMKRFADILVSQEKLYYDIQNKLETLVHDLAISAARKIIHTEISSKPSIVKDIVAQALSLVSDKTQIIIFVNQKDEKFIKEHKKELSEFVKHAKSMRVESSDSVVQGGCIIQTEDGVLNADLNSMINTLNKTLKASQIQYHS